MISNIIIENYKSIEKVTLPLGRVNVFIGENGAGKSNILEAIAITGAASAEKLDNEFLASRGVRVTKPEYMRSAFENDSVTHPIKITTINERGDEASFQLNNDNSTYSKWHTSISTNHANLNFKSLMNVLENFSVKNENSASLSANAKATYSTFLKNLLNSIESDQKFDADGKKTITVQVTEKEDRDNEFLQALSEVGFKTSALNAELSNFIIFSPENSALRLFEKEGQIEPLGINGEGLLKLLNFYSNDDSESILTEIERSLSVLGWFIKLTITPDSNEGKLLITDKYISETWTDFDHRSANEGFFFLLFYFLLFNSKLTPKFFAIDNIDASLNPKLCEHLIRELVILAKANDKQVVLTTHNPAILDGLNLDDEEQRLFVISRKKNGATKVTRLEKKENSKGTPVKLSEMFMRGILGGLPKGF